ncbi:MAG: hypothetical protein DDG58_04495, partial [Ardenticatenia bacterium]
AEDGGAVRVVSWDAQSRRGSQRSERAAVPVLVVTAQQLGVVVQQRAMEDDGLEAALALLEEIPLAGKGVRVDAGWLPRRLVERVVKRGR